MDNYQAVYDAVRSRIGNCDLVEAAKQAFDISHVMPMAQEAITNAGYELTRPSVLYRPRLAKDGNAWIACYGDNLHEGCVGTGDTPEEAMINFDLAWRHK